MTMMRCGGRRQWSASAGGSGAPHAGSAGATSRRPPTLDSAALRRRYLAAASCVIQRAASPCGSARDGGGDPLDLEARRGAPPHDPATGDGNVAAADPPRYGDDGKAAMVAMTRVRVLFFQFCFSQFFMVARRGRCGDEREGVEQADGHDCRDTTAVRARPMWHVDRRARWVPSIIVRRSGVPM